MRFLREEKVEFTAKNDPSTPKTVWGLKALGFFDVVEIEKEVGPAPLRGLNLYLSISPKQETTKKPGESDEEFEKRVAAEFEAAKNAYAAAYDALPRVDQIAIDNAKEHLARYSFAVCCRGVVSIDGEPVSRAECAEKLQMMQPRAAVVPVLTEVSNKIGELANGEPEKKES